VCSVAVAGHVRLAVERGGAKSACDGVGCSAMSACWEGGCGKVMMDCGEKDFERREVFCAGAPAFAEAVTCSPRKRR
jgi:hypothetical protein